jgi:stage II sporulation protein GA (sporulation sigma-E factor processing peptidase)
LDLVFLTNLLIDAALLRMTAWSRRLTFRWWRLALASALGAMYVVMIFVPSMSFLFTTLIKLLFSIAMILIAFGFAHMQHFLRNLGAFYLISFCVAGCMFGLHYVLQSTGELFNGIWFSQTGTMTFHFQTGLLYIALSFLGALWFYRSVQLSRNRQEARQEFIAELQVLVEDVIIVCSGLVDTGNRLFEPLTRTPVLVMESSLWQDHFPPSFIMRINQERAEEIVQDLDEQQIRWRDRLRLVPYKGVHHGTRFMLALKPDKVIVRFRDQQFESSRILIGLKGGQLNSEQAYRAIIHPELVNL